jgi:hypothetical protein
LWGSSPKEAILLRRSFTLSNTRIATAALAAFLATALPVLAQIGPNDSGAGVQRGVQQLNTSGQVGTVTLFNAGNRTRVVLDLKGVPGGRVEAAHIHRGKSCDAIDPKPVYPLSNVVGGRSRSVVNAPESKLLSGNYVVVVHSGTMGKAMEHYVACGQLYSS